MKIKSLKQEKGFTIIEVLIVLAIAGLIVLIVFLAVPALQRNSRNTQRKNDASALVGAVQEYISNHDGSLPATATDITNNAKLSIYTGQVDYTKSATAVTTAPGSDPSKIYLRSYAKCNGPDIATSGATSRNVAAYYFIETSSGSGTTSTCQDF